MWKYDEEFLGDKDDLAVRLEVLVQRWLGLFLCLEVLKIGCRSLVGEEFCDAVFGEAIVEGAGHGRSSNYLD